MSEPNERVPKLPRGRGLKFSGPELFRVALTTIALVGVLVLTRPCASSVSGFVTGFDGSAAEQQMPKPGNVDLPTNMETLRPGMTEDEIKRAIERSKARAVPDGASTAGERTSTEDAPRGGASAARHAPLDGGTAPIDTAAPPVNP